MLATPATVNLEQGGGVDTILIIAVSAGGGGFVLVLVNAIILIYLAYRRIKYSQKYYCNRIGKTINADSHFGPLDHQSKVVCT